MGDGYWYAAAENYDRKLTVTGMSPLKARIWE